MKGWASQARLVELVRAPFFGDLYCRSDFRRGAPLPGVEALVGAPLLSLPAVFTMLGVEAPAAASLLFMPAVYTMQGVEAPAGAPLFFSPVLFTIQSRGR